MESREYILWKECGKEMKIDDAVTLGVHSAYEWKNSRRRLINSATRYIFASKMAGSIYEPNTKEILELGCSDGFGTHFLSEFAAKVVGVDFDEDTLPQNPPRGGYHLY